MRGSHGDALSRSQCRCHYCYNTQGKHKHFSQHVCAGCKRDEERGACELDGCCECNNCFSLLSLCVCLQVCVCVFFRCSLSLATRSSAKNVFLFHYATQLDMLQGLSGALVASTHTNTRARCGRELCSSLCVSLWGLPRFSVHIITPPKKHQRVCECFILQTAAVL